MGKKPRTLQHVGKFEFDHPLLHFVFVRPVVCVGKIWLRVLVSKQHLWAMAGIGPLHRLTYFGPAHRPGQSRSAPILVIARSVSNPSRSGQAGDYEFEMQSPD